MVRAWQMRSWQLLLIQAKVLEKRKVTFRGTRYYLRLQLLKAEALDTNGPLHCSNRLAPNWTT